MSTISTFTNLRNTSGGPVYGIGMEEECQRKLLEDVFGESSSSEADYEDLDKLPSSHSTPPFTLDKHGLLPPPSSSTTINPNSCWERIAPINGLWVCRGFLSSHQQSSLLSSIQTDLFAEGLFKESSHNQAMRFGDLPHWALELSDHIHEVVCFGDKEASIGMLNYSNATYVLPPELLSRDPFFDQLIANVYQPGEGICAHVDLMRFEDGIAIVSLESSCVMHFSPTKRDEEIPVAVKIPVYLTPGSLVIMWGDARYNWKHEINRIPGFQVWQGRELDQKRRTSITLRKLCIAE